MTKSLMLALTSAVALAAYAPAAQAGCSTATTVCYWGTAKTWRCDLANLGSGADVTITYDATRHAIVTAGTVGGAWFSCEGGITTSTVDVKINGTDGMDVIEARDLQPSLYSLLMNIEIYGGDSDDLILGNNISDAGILSQHIEGNAGEDVLMARMIASEMHGGSSTDSLYGSPGDDVLHGGLRNDYIEGGDGDDTIYAGDGNDTVYGGNGQDLIIDTVGDADALYGEGGDDRICDMDPAQAGAVMDGGDGDDTLFYASPISPTTGTGGPGGDVCNDTHSSSWATSCVHVTMDPLVVCAP